MNSAEAPLSTLHLSESGDRAAAVVLAAGSGTRLGSAHNKVFLPLAGRPVVSWSLRSFAGVNAVSRIIMVIREEDRALAEEATAVGGSVEGLDVEVIVGGATRQESELAALRYLAPAIAAGNITLVLIHDGARPLVSQRLIRTVIRTAAAHHAAFPAIEKDDIRRLRSDGSVDASPPGRMIAAQTPQGFRAKPLLAAYERADADSYVGADTVSCWERYSTVPVHWLPGDPRNIKLTYPGDLFDAEQILRDSDFLID